MKINIGDSKLSNNKKITKLKIVEMNKEYIETKDLETRNIKYVMTVKDNWTFNTPVN